MRPRQLPVTDIGRWRTDPYAVYAKRILCLEPLDAIDADVGPLERGILVHRALEEFVRKYPGPLDQNAASRLIEIGEALFNHFKIPSALRASWRPRFANAAQWFVSKDRLRRESIARSHTEVRGELTIQTSCGSLLLTARADRIDVLKDGRAVIIDYKTGNPPKPKQIEALLAPQLPLEAAMLVAGAFPDLGAKTPAELIHVCFSGGKDPGEFSSIKEPATSISQRAIDDLKIRIERYARQSTGYLSQAIAEGTNFRGDYDHLARVGEWTFERAADME